MRNYASFFPGNFWHITDLHWDPSYKLSDNAELVCASSNSQPAVNAGIFGDYVCDSPWHLINSTVYAMKDILPDPDFIVWTGYVISTDFNMFHKSCCLMLSPSSSPDREA